MRAVPSQIRIRGVEHLMSPAVENDKLELIRGDIIPADEEGLVVCVVVRREGVRYPHKELVLHFHQCAQCVRAAQFVGHREKHGVNTTGLVAEAYKFMSDVLLKPSRGR